MDKKFCIQTLTHNSPNRDVFLQRTIDSFLQNTSIPSIVKNKEEKLDWFIRVNETSPKLDKVLIYLQETYKSKVNFEIHIGDNIGVGAGINFLNTLCKDYEYIMFLEGDWECTSESYSGIPKNWLEASIKLLDLDSNISQIFLRRYTSDLEDRQHGMSDWLTQQNIIDKIKVDGVSFLSLKNHCYTNNPTIRRFKTYFDLQVFPLAEYYDAKGAPTEKKDHKDWGKAEIDAYSKSSELGTHWLWFGNFIHIDHLDGLWNSLECKNCKYGFYSTNEWFCLGCSISEDFINLPKHQGRVVREILPIVESFNRKEISFEKALSSIKPMIPNPTINIETLLKKIQKSNEI